MARTKFEIKQEMTIPFMANITLAEKYGFTTGDSFEKVFSLVSFENIIFEIMAYCYLLHEQIFDNHKKENQQLLLLQKSGRLSWYRTMALAFQHGFDLVADQDYFFNGNATAEEIENSKIVKYAAVNENSTESRVILKIAGESEGSLSPITLAAYNSFLAYIKEIKWAGVPVTVINYLPDRLFLNLRIYRNSLLIDEQGNSILYGGKPVETAIKNYMKNLPFDGAFVLQDFAIALRQVEGVEIVEIISAESSWIDAQTNDYGEPQIISVKSIPESGYYEVFNFNNISYVV